MRDGLPLEPDDRVALDVVTASDLRRAPREALEPILQVAGDRTDLVVVAVRAGEGCAVEAFIRRQLGIEAAATENKGRRDG